jgi:hypothetical protein
VAVMGYWPAANPNMASSKSPAAEVKTKRRVKALGTCR